MPPLLRRRPLFPRRFPSSTPVLRRLVRDEVIQNTNAPFESSISSLGRFFAASAPADSTSPQRSNKRISKRERLAMLEDFVQKYRSENEGKFPAMQYTKDHVGGSHYTVREVIQKLQYEHQLSLSKKSTEHDLGEQTLKISYKHHEKRSPLDDGKDIPSPIRVECSTFQTQMNQVHVVNMFDKSESAPSERNTPGRRLPDVGKEFGADQTNQTTSHLPSSTREKVVPMVKSSIEHSNILEQDDTYTVCPPSDHAQSLAVNTVCKEHSAKAKADINLEQTQQKKVMKIMEQTLGDAVSESAVHRGTPESVGTAETPPKKQTIWSNLKSFTTGILDFWKKL